VSNALVSQLLGYLCGLGGLIGAGAYIWVVLKRKRWLNSAGLLLTSLGLMQLSLLIHQNLGMAGLIQAGLAVALLLAAVIVQLIAAVRGRGPWDGTERRGDGE